MSDVIQFPVAKDDLKHTHYTKGEKDRIGVALKTNEIQIEQVEMDNFLLATLGNQKLMSREKLAEFLWVAAFMVDSERRHLPEVDLVGINYE